MALYRNDKVQIPTIYKGRKNVTAVYKGLRLVWQFIKSCFGRGYWLNDKAWSNTDGWAN